MSKSSSDVSRELVEKTYRELGLDPKTLKPIRPLESSSNPPKTPFKIPTLEKTQRQSPKGKSYRFSAVYKNGIVLQLLVKKFTSSLDQRKYYRYISQLDSAVRSFVANIREGYKRPTTKECLDFYGFAQGSLEEARGDIEDAGDDGLLPSRPGSSLAKVGIELKPTPFRPLESPGNSYSKTSFVYDPLREIKRIIGDLRSEDLTYEIFLELINKTDYLTRRAVEGLQKRIIFDEKQKLEGKIRSRWEPPDR